MSRTLYIIDGYAQIFRAFYAIRNGMTSPVTGEPTHAIFGFTGMLHKVLGQLQPDYVVVAMDAPGKTFRDEIYDEYKANRPPMPEDLIPQIPRIETLLQLYGVPVLCEPGLEADDIIASVVKQITTDPDLADVQIKLVSRDKDLEQLLSDRVVLYDVHKDETFDIKALQEQRGIRPDQVIDMLALTGDTADNVPGVPGIGPKTAAQLLQQYGTIDGIYSNIDKIRGKRRENLEQHQDQMPLTRKLVTLRDDAKAVLNMETAAIGPIDVTGVLDIFQQLGFRRYQDEVQQLAETVGTTSGTISESATEQAGEQPAPRPAVQKGTYEIIDSAAALDDLVNTLSRQSLLCLDTETTGLEADARLCGVSLAWEPGHAVYIPTLSPTPESHCSEADVIERLRPILENPDIKKCGHNIKFDTRVLLRAGITVQGLHFDTMLAGILLDPQRPSQRLEALVQQLLGYEMSPISELFGNDDELSLAAVPLDKVAAYAGEDADMTLQLMSVLQDEIEAKSMTRLLTAVETPLAGVLAAMEHRGVLCDPDELTAQENELSTQVERLRADIHQLAGETFNIDSPKQLSDLLFNTLGFKPVKKTKTGYSTDMEVLTELARDEDENNPVSALPRLLIEYRQLNKLITTYFGNLRDAIRPSTGRIHSTFHQLVTATGRLASQDPNLQNIPVRTDVGRHIRKAFKAPAGHLLLCADYSQIELRVLAHLSEDPGLIEAFTNDLDIHASVASRVFGVPMDAVSSVQRDRAKVINFGIIYGITPYGLSRRIPDLDVGAAGRLIDDYKKRYPGIDRFLQQCITEATEYGFVTTILGRQRAIPEIQSSSRNRRNHGERLAINTVVQGSAADLIKIAMVNVEQRIAQDNLPMRLVLQIHDELVLEVAKDAAEAGAAAITDEMEKAMALRIPLKADVGLGENWMDAK